MTLGSFVLTIVMLLCYAGAIWSGRVTIRGKDVGTLIYVDGEEVKQLE